MFKVKSRKVESLNVVLIIIENFIDFAGIT
jgi:hypothetical protein